MQVGSVVRYQNKYPDGMDIDWIGMVIKIEPIDGRPFLRVEWNNGLWDYRTKSELEVICE